MRIVRRDADSYVLDRPKVIYAAAVLRAVERMLAADFAWGCPNETSLRVGFTMQ